MQDLPCRTLFRNGKVWEWLSPVSATGIDAAGRLVEWLIVSAEGTIDAMGVGEPSAAYDEVVDLQGNLVLPGLQDAHIHLGLLGESAFYVSLSSATSVAGMCAAVAEHADRYGLPC
jgi:predicted amidohydrolase YtcJ